MVKRIAYIVGNFPSKSETWINHEIIQLMKEGFDVKIFSFREKKPLPSLDEQFESALNDDVRLFARRGLIRA